MVKLGGVDGLIHITDLSWSRINQSTQGKFWIRSKIECNPWISTFIETSIQLDWTIKRSHQGMLQMLI
jgi:hypothetical protein